MNRLLLFLCTVLLTVNEMSGQLSWQRAFPSLPAFSLPIELVNGGDGTNRFFVAQQRGIISVFQNSPSAATRKVFLNISDSVSSTGSETGLLGVAFHPNYEANGYFYVHHTNTVGGQLRSYIARYQVSATDPDSAAKSSRFVLLVVDQPFSNHNGGKIAFGPDGYLYIAFGDGGSANDPGNRAQNRSVILGKILRIDVDRTTITTNYAIPPTNPFVGNIQGWREEIWAYGMRNPWRFSFDVLNGQLWCGDVGQDAREEVDIIRGGGNYGWRLMEGFLCTPGVNPGCLDTAGLIRPVWDYPNAGSDISVTGGYVYRGSSIPSAQGKYFCADYGSGKTWMLTLVRPDSAAAQLVSDEAYSISTFGVDENNELFTVGYGNGFLYRLTGPSSSAAEEFTPTQFRLEQNYPNPFNPTTTIAYQLPRSEFVSLKLFNLLGKEVRTLVNQHKDAGSYQVILDAGDLPSGVYLYHLHAGRFSETRRLILMK